MGGSRAGRRVGIGPSGVGTFRQGASVVGVSAGCGWGAAAGEGLGGAPVGGLPDSGEAWGGGAVVEPGGYGLMPVRPVVAGGRVGGDGSAFGDAVAELAAGLVESV